MVSSPAIELFDGNREHADATRNRNAHLKQVLEHIFVSGRTKHGYQGDSMTDRPKANDGAQDEGHNAKGGFEHSHAHFLPERHTD